MKQDLKNARVQLRNSFRKFPVKQCHQSLIAVSLFLDYLLFLVVMRQEEINCCEAFSKRQIK